jgi:hypothetical protein
MDKEILKLKIKSLISLRTNLINVLIVLIGGVVSLSFLPIHLVPSLFGVLGFFYILVFLSNLISTNNKIDKLLINGEEKEK